MSIGRFYAGIAALVWSPATAKYLLLRRSGKKDYAPGVWECVTGRVEQGEGYQDALLREVREELGVEVQVETILGTTHFYRGATDAEHELVGVVYLCSLSDPKSIRTSAEHTGTATVRISEEHTEYRWLSAEQALELLSSSDPSTRWARRVIERAEIIRPQLPKDLLDFHRKTGFELG